MSFWTQGLPYLLVWGRWDIYYRDKTLSVSVEARRQEGEKYSGIKGIMNAYELQYV